MILKSFVFQCDFDFKITTSQMILILYRLYLGDLILKSSTNDDFVHLCIPGNLPHERLPMASSSSSRVGTTSSSGIKGSEGNCGSKSSFSLLSSSLEYNSEYCSIHRSSCLDLSAMSWPPLPFKAADLGTAAETREN